MKNRIGRLIELKLREHTCFGIHIPDDDDYAVKVSHIKYFNGRFFNLVLKFEIPGLKFEKQIDIQDWLSGQKNQSRKSPEPVSEPYFPDPSKPILPDGSCLEIVEFRNGAIQRTVRVQPTIRRVKFFIYKQDNTTLQNDTANVAEKI